MFAVNAPVGALGLMLACGLLAACPAGSGAFEPSDGETSADTLPDRGERPAPSEDSHGAPVPVSGGRCPTKRLEFPPDDPRAEGVVADGPADLQVFEGVTHFDGSLAVFFKPASVAELTPLSCLQRIGGLNIGLKSEGEFGELQFLSELRSVDRKIYISNDAITSLRGLNQLESAGELLLSARGVTSLDGLQVFRRGDISIGDVPIRDLRGLERWEGSRLELSTLPQLESLAGLHHPDLHRGIVLANLPRLQSLDDLPIPAEAEAVMLWSLPLIADRDLERLAALEKTAFLSLGLLPEVTTVRGLRGLKTIRRGTDWIEFDVRGLLRIVELPALRDLTGLEQLRSIDGNLLLESNFGLDSLRGIEGLEVITEQLQLRELPLLEGLDPLRFQRTGSLRQLGGLEVLGDLSRIRDCEFVELVTDLDRIGNDVQHWIPPNIYERCTVEQ